MSLEEMMKKSTKRFLIMGSPKMAGLEEVVTCYRKHIEAGRYFLHEHPAHAS